MILVFFLNSYFFQTKDFDKTIHEFNYALKWEHFDYTLFPSVLKGVFHTDNFLSLFSVPNVVRHVL